MQAPVLLTHAGQQEEGLTSVSADASGGAHGGRAESSGPGGSAAAHEELSSPSLEATGSERAGSEELELRGGGSSAQSGSEGGHESMQHDASDDVMLELSPEQMAELEGLQPGRDGSQASRRAEFEAYEMPELSVDQQCWLREYLMEKLSTYCRRGERQGSVTDDLRTEKGPKGGRAQWQRRAMPHSFKSMLNALKQLGGTDTEQFTFDYAMCPCGFLYR